MCAMRPEHEPSAGIPERTAASAGKTERESKRAAASGLTSDEGARREDAAQRRAVASAGKTVLTPEEISCAIRLRARRISSGVSTVLPALAAARLCAASSLVAPSSLLSPDAAARFDSRSGLPALAAVRAGLPALAAARFGSRSGLPALIAARLGSCSLAFALVGSCSGRIAHTGHDLLPRLTGRSLKDAFVITVPGLPARPSEQAGSARGAPSRTPGHRGATRGRR